MTARAHRLPGWSLFAATLSAAGLPIYIFAPKYYADSFGVGLAAIGALLFLLRLIDVVQDPVFGWLIDRIAPARRGFWVGVAAAVMALSMIGLFAVAPPIAPLWWFGVTITGLFSAFSFLTILFYGAGVAQAATLPGGHLRLAGWRESGGLIGVCLAAIAPSVLVRFTPDPYAVFAIGFAAVVAIAVWAMRGQWEGGTPQAPTPFKVILSDPLARRLLGLALVNAMPLAVTSTLFLFFVESRLAAPGWEGPLLVLFFLSAAVSAPAWSGLAARFGAKPVLLVAMGLAVLSFGGVFLLQTGQVGLFAVICVVSGAAVGADFTLLPAMFATRLAQVAPRGGTGFGLWGLVNKLTLAFAAAALFPLLDRAGFVAGAAAQPEAALWLLTLLYAGVPSVLKLVAMAVLAATKLEGPR